MKKPRGSASGLVEFILRVLLSRIDVYIDRPDETDGGVKIGTFAVEPQTDKKPVNVSVAVPNLKNYNGKHALFLVFNSPTKEKSICMVNSLQFK